MCGIVGYIGNNVEKVLIKKLKKLEYRGYDSAGIAVGANDGFSVFKAKGEIKNLESIVKETKGATAGIGHTRWATHGKPDEINAHPHISSDKKWVLVHNGIIENYGELKEKLIAAGMDFYSQTDSETIAKLLQYYSCEDGLETLRKTVTALRGSYALAIMRAGENAVYFSKNRSPLFVALNGKNALIASDVICFKDFAKEYYVLEDGEFGVVKDGKLTVKNEIGDVSKSPVILENFDDYSENEYDHYMLKEIFETKNSLTSIAEYYSVPENYKELSKININNYDKIVLVGCGTAYHACLFGAKFLHDKIGVDCFTFVASEFRYSDQKINEKTLLFLISQSGETADTLAAMELAHEKGAKTVAIVNVEYSTLAKRASVCVPIKAGTEVAVASTKAYSSQIAVLYLVAEILEASLKNTEFSTDELKEFIKYFNFGQIQLYRMIADVLRYQRKIFMIGRGADYYSANEASLKIKETCYIDSDTYYAGELKHGFLALIDETTYVVVFATEKSVLSKLLCNAEEAYSRGAKLILFTCFDVEESFTSKCEHVIKINDSENGLQAINNIVPWQLIAYYTSIAKGINPDRPRNLAKSVTVE